MASVCRTIRRNMCYVRPVTIKEVKEEKKERLRIPKLIEWVKNRLKGVR